MCALRFTRMLQPIMKMTAPSAPKPKVEGEAQSMGLMYALSFAYNIVQVSELHNHRNFQVESEEKERKARTQAGLNEV